LGIVHEVEVDTEVLGSALPTRTGGVTTAEVVVVN
jgi:hypothetical protein